MSTKSIGFSTKAIHGKKHLDKHEEEDRKPVRSLSTPIFMASTFAFKSAEHGAQVFAGEDDDYFYTRISNPTTQALENEIAFLENTEAGLAFASGMAAISHLTFSLVKPGEKLVFGNTLYGGTYKFFADTCPDFFHMNTVSVSAADTDAVAKAVDDDTKMLFFETPANPTMEIVDLAACVEIAHRHNAVVAVDNTFATPYLQNPIDFGADVVVHSATKYLNGHGDVVAGLLAGPKKIIDMVHGEMIRDVGGIMSPFNAWLILRGIRTLPVRVDRHCEGAMEIAKYLSFHPKVERVYYPGLRTHPGQDLIAKQMRGFGGMIAFDIKGGRDAGRAFCNSVRLWTLAVSLGDVDSLIQHPASMTHSTYTDEALDEAGIGKGLVRLSVGLEDVDDLIEDLRQAFKKV